MIKVARAAIVGAVLTSTSTLAFAQVQQVSIAPVAAQQVSLAPMQANVLRSGTSVSLRTSEELTTEGKNLKVGYRFNLETAEPVTVNGQVVIPVGTRAIGEVTTVRNKGMWGKSGGITARLVYLKVGDRTIRLSGSLDDRGHTGTVGVVAAAVVIPVVGFFVTGTSARIPTGSFATAFTEEDVPLAFAAAAPVQPAMVVNALPSTALVQVAPPAAPISPANAPTLVKASAPSATTASLAK